MSTSTSERSRRGGLLPAVRRAGRLLAGGRPANTSAFLASRRGLLKGALAGGALAVVGTQSLTEGASQPASRSIYGCALPEQTAGQVREYWLQAESFLHNLVPNGRDGLMGQTFTDDQTSYWAVGYRAYSANWQQPLNASDEMGDNRGIPGPILRAAVGDTLRIHFRNNDAHYQFPHSLHPHGVVYTPENDGSWTARAPDKPGTAVAFGETYTYEWTAAPSSVGTWPYHDHSMPQSLAPATPPDNGDMPPAGAGDAPMNGSSMGAMGMPELGAELGLFGMIVITDASTPTVDREICLFMHDLYQDDVPDLSQDYDCFNGYAFLENTPTLQVKQGEHVRFRIMALGKEFHAFHIHGHRWLYNGRYDDTLVLGPATTVSFDFVEDNPGEWLYHCHVTDHMMGGMIGLYTVTAAAP